MSYETPTLRTCPHCGASFDAEFQNGVIGYSCLTMVGSEGVDRTHACYERENAALRRQLTIMQISRDSFHTRLKRALACEKRLRETLEKTHPAEIWDKARMYYTSETSFKGPNPIIQWHTDMCKSVDAALAFDGREGA
jgi:hypothetical protein